MFHHGCTVYIEIYYKPLCHVNYMEKMFNVLTFLQPLIHSIFFFFFKGIRCVQWTQKHDS